MPTLPALPTLPIMGCSMSVMRGLENSPQEKRLFDAIRKGDHAGLKALLESKTVKVDATEKFALQHPSPHGVTFPTSLHIAAQEGSCPEITRLLLDVGAKLGADRYQRYLDARSIQVPQPFAPPTV